MKQKLQEYALVAEILGGLAIVISLLFVGFQISDGNREARAATKQAVVDSEMFLQSHLLLYANIWENVVIAGDMSDEVETRRGIVLFNMMVAQDEFEFQMQDVGYLHQSESLGVTFASNSFLEVWRKSPGAIGRSPDFLEVVDRQISMRKVSD